MQEEKLDIGCPIFLQQEIKIEPLTLRINSSRNIEEKAQFAQELAGEVEILLSCKDYNEDDFDCINCQTISTLRKKTVKLILMTSMVLGK